MTMINESSESSFVAIRENQRFIDYGLAARQILLPLLGKSLSLGTPRTDHPEFDFMIPQDDELIGGGIDASGQGLDECV